MAKTRQEIKKERRENTEETGDSLFINLFKKKKFWKKARRNMPEEDKNEHFVK
jgi:hypothetical protein